MWVTVSEELVNYVKKVVYSEMTVIEEAPSYPFPIFMVIGETKEPFKRLYKKLRPYGLVPLLRRTEDGRIILRILSYPQPPLQRKKSIRVNIILFIATLVTVSLFAFIYISGLVEYGLISSPSPFDLLVNVALYTIAIFSIIGLHEIGHKIAAYLHGVDSSPPYFIPFFPFGTMGAFIIQRSPPVNRDALFDIGISGPLVSFVCTIPVAMAGIHLSYIVSSTTVEQIPTIVIPMPMLIHILSWIANMSIPDYATVILHPLGIAAWLGALVTALNLFPIWQLDGGHVFIAVFGRKNHKVATAVALMILFLLGYWLMFFLLLLLLMFSGGEHPGALDEVSPLSTSRKIIFLIAIVILILCIAPPASA